MSKSLTRRGQHGDVPQGTPHGNAIRTTVVLQAETLEEIRKLAERIPELRNGLGKVNFSEIMRQALAMWKSYYDNLPSSAKSVEEVLVAAAREAAMKRKV